MDEIDMYSVDQTPLHRWSDRDENGLTVSERSQNFMEDFFDSYLPNGVPNAFFYNYSIKDNDTKIILEIELENELGWRMNPISRISIAESLRDLVNREMKETYFYAS